MKNLFAFLRLLIFKKLEYKTLRFKIGRIVSNDMEILKTRHIIATPTSQGYYDKHGHTDAWERAPINYGGFIGCLRAFGLMPARRVSHGRSR